MFAVQFPFSYIFFPFIAFTMIKDAQLFVHCCKNGHASDRISTGQLICMITFRLYFFISCCICSDFIQVLFLCFFYIDMYNIIKWFCFFLTLNLRIKDSLINIRFRNYWFKCCLVQLNLKHHKFFMNLRPPIFINLL